MNCDQTRDWLAQQAVGPAAASPEAEGHLAGCSACRAAQSGLARLGEWTPEEPPLGLVDKTMRAVREQPAREFWVDRWIAAISSWLQSRHPLTAAAMACALFLVVLAPNWVRGRAQGALTGCQANLQSLALAVEDYASTHQGQLPASLEQLKLRALPICPSANQPTYALSVSAREQSYTLYCAGNHHGEENEPRYSSTRRP